ncbi:MAG: hydrolase [Frankiales bacterium]|nr:hydrolase [Frankiales bacterium]
MPSSEELHNIAVRLAGLAQSGLSYTTNPYELDRFAKARDLAAELFAAISDKSAADVRAALSLDSGYATPKVDVRGAVFDDNERVLLTRERNDGLWSLPGGWLDSGHKPASGVVTEIREETGYGAEVVKLVGCWDRATRGHTPLFPMGIVKLFFLCRRAGEVIAHDELETLEIGWFGLDELPPLSLGRVNEWEIQRCRAHHRDPSLATEFD